MEQGSGEQPVLDSTQSRAGEGTVGVGQHLALQEFLVASGSEARCVTQPCTPAAGHAPHSYSPVLQGCSRSCGPGLILGVIFQINMSIFQQLKNSDGRQLDTFLSIIETEGVL